MLLDKPATFLKNISFTNIFRDIDIPCFTKKLFPGTYFNNVCFSWCYFCLHLPVKPIEKFTFDSISRLHIFIISNFFEGQKPKPSSQAVVWRYSVKNGLLLKPGPGPWTRTQKNLDPKNSGPWISWTLKNLGSEKHGINMGLKNMSDFRELCFKNIIRNVICCLEVHRYLTKFIRIKTVLIITQL